MTANEQNEFEWQTRKARIDPINDDWTAKYGHGIELLETFVDRERFRGTCYRAAGWVHVGATAGRSRNDRDQTLSVPVKDIYLRPLFPDFRRRLCA